MNAALTVVQRFFVVYFSFDVIINDVGVFICSFLYEKKNLSKLKPMSIVIYMGFELIYVMGGIYAIWVIFIKILKGLPLSGA